jgi:hypothetical protein
MSNDENVVLTTEQQAALDALEARALKEDTLEIRRLVTLGKYPEARAIAEKWEGQLDEWTEDLIAKQEKAKTEPKAKRDFAAEIAATVLEPVAEEKPTNLARRSMITGEVFTPKEAEAPPIAPETPAGEVEAAGSGAASSVSGAAQSAGAAGEEPEGPSLQPEFDPAMEGRAERFQFDEEATTPVLSKAAPMDNAKAFARDRLRKNGALATYYYHGDWWQWNGRFYEIAPADRIAGSVYDYLDPARARTGDGDERFRPKPEHADQLIKCLKACVAVDDRDGPPRWLDNRKQPSAANLLVFQNCLVDVETGEVSDLTPTLWAHGGVGFAFDPRAQCPRWERFLEEAFPGDRESQTTIEEQLGYGMTNDTRFEKGALWIGVKRSGKTTLAWVQERLAGVGACVSLSFHDWMKTENSREHLVGKKVGVFADVRLKPAKAYGMTGYDPGGIDHQSAQFLLNIIGRDKVSLGRKFKKAWEGRLFIKIIITSNEVPNLQDAGGVLSCLTFSKASSDAKTLGSATSLKPNCRGSPIAASPRIAVFARGVGSFNRRVAAR